MLLLKNELDGMLEKLMVAQINRPEATAGHLYKFKLVKFCM
jgi:hypothetical protein